MPGSDYLGSFLAKHPPAPEINEYSQNLSESLEHQLTNSKTWPETASLKGKQDGGKSRGYDCMTKVELLERAKKRKILGRSKMTKAQLITALRSKNAPKKLK